MCVSPCSPPQDGCADKCQKCNDQRLKKLVLETFRPLAELRAWRPGTSAAPAQMQIFQKIVRWIDGLMRLPAWAEPWPAGERAAV
jgi:hypothetical protein